MERGLKERLVGAAVLVALAVVFIPMLLDDSSREVGPLTDSNIPERPAGEDGFSSRIIPAEPEPVDVVPPQDLAMPETEEPVVPPPEPEAPVESAAEPEADADAGVEPQSEPESGSEPATQSTTDTAPEPETAPEKKPEAEAAPAPAATAEPEPPQSEQAESESGDTAGKPSGWVVQLGSFAQEDNARELDKRLREAGFASFVEQVSQSGKTVYRVRIGPEVKRSEAEKSLGRIEDQFELKGIVVSYP